MRMPELPALRALAPLQAQPAQAGGGTQGGRFAQAMRSTEAEITALVHHGWPASELPALGAEGMARRAALLQAALQPALTETTASLAPAPGSLARSAPVALPAGQAVPTAAQRDFLETIAPWAREAGEALGVAPNLVAAHAALESGWGRRPLRGADGGDSHNLFGIKASGNWRGASVQALTTEYEAGEPARSTEAFRAYPDHASAFRDYAQLLQNSPRYQAALNVGADAEAFAQGLARGGYATDPDYAAKLARVARQVQSRGPAVTRP